MRLSPCGIAVVLILTGSVVSLSAFGTRPGLHAGK